MRAFLAVAGEGRRIDEQLLEAARLHLEQLTPPTPLASSRTNG